MNKMCLIKIAIVELLIFVVMYGIFGINEMKKLSPNTSIDICLFVVLILITMITMIFLFVNKKE
jgi:hypothetical protein